MSSGTMLVRYPDGSIRYGIYHGTSEIAWDHLFATLDGAWEARRTNVLSGSLRDAGPLCIRRHPGRRERRSAWMADRTCYQASKEAPTYFPASLVGYTKPPS